MDNRHATNYLNWDAEKLARRANQEWEMAGLARQDGDKADAERRIVLAQLYEARLRELR